jgi:hypothetical protein
MTPTGSRIDSIRMWFLPVFVGEGVETLAEGVMIFT